MAFTVKGEYERLFKYQLNSFDGKLPFEYGCITGYVTKIEYIPLKHYQEEAIIIYGYIGSEEHSLLYITENDVRKRYQDRKYRYNKKYNILERFDR